MDNPKQFAVYIMASRPKTGTLYTGMTAYLGKRISQHKGIIPGGSFFARKYRTDTLVYVELCESFESAKRREDCIKRWKRALKINLIESKNPQWKDLFNDLANWI